MKKLFSFFAFLIALSVFADSYKLIVRRANGKGYFLATDSIDSIYFSDGNIPEKNVFEIGHRDSVTDTLVIEDTIIIRDTVTKYVYRGVVSTDSWNVNIENPIVADYMNEVDYSDYLDDYTYTKINDYTKIHADYRKDEPRGISLEWDNPGKNQTIVHSYQGNSIAWTDTICAADDASTADLYNLVPGKRCDYTVYSDSTPLKTSHFFTQGQVRMMYLPSLHNVRDIGGWRTVDRKRIKYGRIFRGGEMNNFYNIKAASCPDSTHQISSEDSLYMHDKMNIRLDLDLRDSRDLNLNDTDKTNDRNHTELGQDVEYYNEMVNYNPGYFEREGYNQRWGRAVKKIVKALSEGKNVYVHCIWGGDRTGILAMLIEGVLGVPEEDFTKDFELTSLVYKDKTRTLSYWGYILNYLKGLQGETLSEKIATYLKNAGVTQEEIDTLRQIMTE